MLLQGGGGAEDLFIGFDFMGRSRGRGFSKRLGAKMEGGVGRRAALCFVAHIAESQQVSVAIALAVGAAPLITLQHRLLLSAGTLLATDHTAHGGAGIEEIVELQGALVRECGVAAGVAMRYRACAIHTGYILYMGRRTAAGPPRCLQVVLLQRR